MRLLFVLSIYHSADLGICRSTYQFIDIHLSTYISTGLSPFRSINPLSLSPPIYRPMNLRARRRPYYQPINSPFYRHSAIKPNGPEFPIDIAGVGASRSNSTGHRNDKHHRSRRGSAYPSRASRSNDRPPLILPLAKRSTLTLTLGEMEPPGRPGEI